jgi:two-component system cell cycle response regulator
MLTSKSEDDDIVAGLEAGADDYLIKPCNPRELNARLHTGRFNATHDSLTGLWNRGAIGCFKDQSELSRAGARSVFDPAL